MPKDNVLPSFSSLLSSPAVQIVWGIFCLGLIALGMLPLMVGLYAAILGHVAILFLSSDDVTSNPNVRLVMILCVLEYLVTCYRVTQSQNIGHLLQQGLCIGIAQTGIHLIYLMTSSSHVTHTICLGEGKGRQKLLGKEGEQ